MSSKKLESDEVKRLKIALKDAKEQIKLLEKYGKYLDGEFVNAKKGELLGDGVTDDPEFAERMARTALKHIQNDVVWGRV